jgi:hypothetical protein
VRRFCRWYATARRGWIVTTCPLVSVDMTSPPWQAACHPVTSRAYLSAQHDQRALAATKPSLLNIDSAAVEGIIELGHRRFRAVGPGSSSQHGARVEPPRCRGIAAADSSAPPSMCGRAVGMASQRRDASASTQPVPRRCVRVDGDGPGRGLGLGSQIVGEPNCSQGWSEPVGKVSFCRGFLVPERSWLSSLPLS